MEYLISFAQQWEDIILYHLLKNVHGPIRYIDVGANNPVLESVTKFFYDRGGSGINIEPQQKEIDLLNEDRPRDINLQVGISDKAGELTLYGDDVCASFDCNNQNANQKIAHIVPVVTLSDVFNSYVQKDENIHFLKIDVEGWERKCLEGMDFTRFRPWILCIESIIPCTTISAHENWEDLVLGQNYVLIGDTHVNRYYVAAERLHEIQEFRKPKELNSIYRIITLKTNKIAINESIIPMIQEKKIVLFGGGEVGQSYWKQIQDTGLQLISWVASKPKEGFPMNSVESLDELEYDVILIAVDKEDMVEEIRTILTERGVPQEKILWKRPIAKSAEGKCIYFAGKNYYAYF